MIKSISSLAMVRPIDPITLVGIESFAIPFAIGILALLLIVGISLLIGGVVNKVMVRKGFETNLTFNLIVSGILPIALFLRYGASIELIQGMFLAFILMYASWSDITSHTVDDYLSVLIFAIGISSINTIGLASMLFGVFAVFVPQIVMSLIPKCKPIGGADLKISTAIAFLLGWQRGIIAFVAGLFIAVIFMTLYNKFNDKNEEADGTEKPFALVPFLSVAAMALYMF